MTPKVSVIVTNWNGLPLLKKNFLKVIETSPEAIEIIFTDDASKDDSVAYIKELQKSHPQIKIIAHKKNQGFGKNSNFAVKSAIGDYVVLLNNDILPHLGYISQALAVFHQKDNVFGVGFAELDHENWAHLMWKEGYIQHQPGLDVTKLHISGWVSGGSSVINKESFLRLGGFDEAYAPFYSEDLDLGFRAWKSGYNLYWQPTSVVEHKHESTMSKFPRRLLDYVKERNRLLSVWRNITDKKLLSQNRLALIGRVLTGPNYLKIILAANRQMKNCPPPTVFPVRTDQQIFDLFK